MLFVHTFLEDWKIPIMLSAAVKIYEQVNLIMADVVVRRYGGRLLNNLMCCKIIL